MKAKTIRVVAPIAIGTTIAIGFAFKTGLGDLCSIGWGSSSVLCPLGALSTMLASKTVSLVGLLSVGIGVALMLVLGRFFCAWACPVPLVKRFPSLFSSRREKRKHVVTGAADLASQRFKSSRRLDSRVCVLAAALLATTIFGFPVFCLVCPIGLSFALVFLVISLFTGGDVTWSLVIVPALLFFEVVGLRRWCGAVCPLGAAMSLLSRLSKWSLRPKYAAEDCLERKGMACGKCGMACEQDIDPKRFLQSASASECTRCAACVDACPAHAISLSLSTRIRADGKPGQCSKQPD